MNQSLLQVFKQFAGFWKILGVNQRVSLVLAGVLVLAGLVGIVVYSARPEYSLLYGKLPEGEASKVIAALDEAKIPYKLGGAGGSILVPAEKVYQVRMQLAGKGIPRGDGVGFEIFDKPNFGISDFIQRANYLRAIQGELARTIAQVDNVESARVMVAIPENRLLVDQQKKPTASVFLKVRGSTQLPPQTINAIRFLVANAVEGLQANSVVVADNLGNTLSENSDGDSLVGLTTTQLAARKNLEQYLSKKAEGMLDLVLGPGQSVVRVAAEINYDTNTKTEVIYDPDGQVIRSSTIDDENTDQTSAAPPGGGGVPGVATNSSETNAVASAQPTSNKTKKKLTTNQYEINQKSNSMMQAAGGIKRLSAAVFVAAKFEGSGAARKPVARTKEELDKLKRTVQSALGIQEGDPTRQDQITLEEISFNDQPAIEMTQQLEKQSKREFWWNLAGKSVYPLLALGIMGAFWRAFKRTSTDNLPLGAPLGEGEEELNGGGGHPKGRPKRPQVVTVEVLNQLIRESPNNMNQAIRAWMSRDKAN